MVVENLSYFPQMHFFHTYQLLCMGSSINFFGVSKKDNNQDNALGDGEICCTVPLHILAPKPTLATAKELAVILDMFMPSKTLLKNAQILLSKHKCETCPDLSVFNPYKVASNAECQQTWYQDNKEK